MIKSKDDLMELIKSRLPEDMSDEDISFLEDITDTVNDFESRAKDNTDWKARYEENDNAWKKKYADRFFNNEDDSDDDNSGNDDDYVAPKTFDELFTVKGV